MLILISILKIIGIILLVVLGLGLYLMLAPFIYGVSADFNKKNYSVSINDPIHIYKVSLKRLENNNELLLSFLFGLIKIYPLKEVDEKTKAKREQKREKKKKKKEEKKNTENEQEKPKKPDVKTMLKRAVKLFTDSRSSGVVNHILKNIIWFSKKLLPKKIRADIEFALNAPDATGKVTGVLALIPYMHWKDVHIYPDFSAEESYVSGSFYIEGWTSPVLIIVMAIRIIADKRVRRMISIIRGKV